MMANRCSRCALAAVVGGILCAAFAAGSAPASVSSSAGDCGGVVPGPVIAPQTRGSYDDYMQMLDELDELDEEAFAERLDELDEAPADAPPAPLQWM